MATSERRFIIAILFATAAARIAGAEGTTTAQAGMRRTKSRLRAAGQQEEWELLLPSTWCRRPGHERLAGATQAHLRPAHRDHVRHTANVIQPRVQFNLGIFQNGPGAGFEANKTPDCYRCYTQWAGFTVGNQASYWKYLDQTGIQTFTVGEAESSLVFAYTYDWTKMRPGTPNPKGFAPYPDGLSSTISLEDPNKHAAKGEAGGNTLAGLAGLKVPALHWAAWNRFPARSRSRTSLPISVTRPTSLER
jgi:hypothetical protein